MDKVALYCAFFDPPLARHKPAKPEIALTAFTIPELPDRHISLPLSQFCNIQRLTLPFQ
jgi:hypothetical protein